MASSNDPPRVDWDFKIPGKLGYDAPIAKQKYLRISMFFNKRKDVSDEYFQNHWHHVHADLVTSTKAFKENKILRYNQFRQHPELKALAKRLGHGQYPSLDYDACTEFWFEKIEDFEAFTQSEEYKNGSGDMKNFVHIPDGVKVMIGYDNIVFGKAVPGYGSDGVVRADLAKIERN